MSKGIKVSKLAALILLVCLISSFVPKCSIQADAAPVFIGGVNIIPYSENNIMLTKETLNINFEESGRFNGSVAHVDAKFSFANTGDKISLQVGFPFGLTEKQSFSVPNVLNSEVKINGEEITPHLIGAETGDKYQPWIYFDVNFKKNETKTIEVTYDAIPAGGYFLYVLKTGALWKGPIGTLDITLTFPYEAVSPNVLSVTPSGYTVQGNKILYQLKNFEPTTNIEVEFLPFDFYGKIKPLEDKALKTNSATDWFNYALALFPNNPLGSFDRFVSWYRTPAFSDYVSDVLEKALSLQKEDTPEYIILKEIYNAHFSSGMPFVDGYDVLPTLDVNYYYIPFESTDFLEKNINNIKSPTEGKIFGFLLEYIVYTDLKQNDTSKAISDFNTLLEVADKYFDENDYNEVSMRLYSAMLPNVYGEQRLISPAFDGCFIPSISIQGNTVYIYYNVPVSMALYLEEFDTNKETDVKRNYRVNSYFETVPPYRYVVSITLPLQDEKEFSEAKDYSVQYVKNNNSEPYVSSCKFVSKYLSDILDDITLSNGKLVFIKPSIDCTSKVSTSLKSLTDEIAKIDTYEKKFKSTQFDNSFAGTFLSSLSLNKLYFDNLPKNPQIEFRVETQTPTSSNNEIQYVIAQNSSALVKNIVIIVLAVAVTVLIVIVVLLRKRGNKAQNA